MGERLPPADQSSGNEGGRQHDNWACRSMWLFKKILSIEPILAIVQWIYDRISSHWVAILALIGSGGIMAYLAAISDFLKPYAPVSWDAVGIVTTISVAFAFYLFSWKNFAWHILITCDRRRRDPGRPIRYARISMPSACQLPISSITSRFIIEKKRFAIVKYSVPEV